MTETVSQIDLYVVPCGAAKTDHPTQARLLYTSENFQYTIARVEREAGAAQADYGTTSRALILSALHGLLDPDQLVAPYDVKMGDEGSIPVEQLAGQLRPLTDRTVNIYAFLPKAYRDRLRAAADLLNDDDALTGWVHVHDVYEAAPGIGYQRGVVGCIG